MFDARTQGYDGVLNGGCTYESGETGEEPREGEFAIRIEFIFNIETDELNKISAEESVNPADLFDALDIVATPVGEGAEFSLSYECA